MSHRIEGRRFNMLLADDLRARLKAESQRTGVPVVVLIRRGIEQVLSGNPPAPTSAVPVIAGGKPQSGQLYRWVVVEDDSRPDVEAVLVPVGAGFDGTPSVMTSLPQPEEQSRHEPHKPSEQPSSEPFGDPPATTAEFPVRRRRRVRVNLAAKP